MKGKSLLWALIHGYCQSVATKGTTWAVVRAEWEIENKKSQYLLIRTLSHIAISPLPTTLGHDRTMSQAIFSYALSLVLSRFNTFSLFKQKKEKKWRNRNLMSHNVKTTCCCRSYLVYTRSASLIFHHALVNTETFFILPFFATSI